MSRDRTAPIATAALLLLLLAPLANAASDILKEQRWADQLAEFIVVGEPMHLETKTQRFFAIYTETHKAIARGGLIILHGRGAHPDWPDVVSPLRTKMPDYGWDTLSIQMPVLSDNHAGYAQYAALSEQADDRIQAAIQFFLDKGRINIVLAGHSLGAAMASHFISERSKEDQVKAFVAIGLGVYPSLDKKSPLYVPAHLKEITIPMLDIFGSQDLDNVYKSKKKRMAISIKNNPRYRQVEISGANHFHSNLEHVLIKRIRGWLDQNAASMQLEVPSRGPANTKQPLK